MNASSIALLGVVLATTPAVQPATRTLPPFRQPAKEEVQRHASTATPNPPPVLLTDPVQTPAPRCESDGACPSERAGRAPREDQRHRRIARPAPDRRSRGLTARRARANPLDERARKRTSKRAREGSRTEGNRRDRDTTTSSRSSGSPDEESHDSQRPPRRRSRPVHEGAANKKSPMAIRTRSFCSSSNSAVALF